jgi:hypothetical protein
VGATGGTHLGRLSCHEWCTRDSVCSISTLGDALYAAMVYALFRLTGRITRITVWAAVTMTAIEFFQLTRVPAGMLRSKYLAVRACGGYSGRNLASSTYLRMR